MYLSAIAIDFGSSNSGAARIDTVKDGRLVYSTPEFCHTDGYYSKAPTWYWISPELLNAALYHYDELEDSDFRILSRNFQAEQNPNIVWGSSDFFVNDGPGNINKLSSNGWVEFKYFKMMIYLDVPYTFNGREYPIELVVKLFLRVIKIECLHRESSSKGRPVSSAEIQWGITIPSIWSSANKELMTRICSDVFGNHVRILSEPEGPVISERIHAGSGKLTLVKGTKSLVIDIGGGTTDICLLEDSDDEDAKFTRLASCDGIGIGGNIIDQDFYKYIVRFFSKGLTSDNGIPYDTLSDTARYEMLYSAFINDPINNLIMEKSWILFKHHINPEYQVPRQYIQWLDRNGHREVANRVRSYVLGDITFNQDDFNTSVFKPSFDKICRCVEEFVTKNLVHFQSNEYPINIIFAGGLSLMQSLRDRIVHVVNAIVGRSLPYNISNTSLLASGSIMDGATYILLYRKSISRIAPYYIYDPLGGVNLINVRDAYNKLGTSIKFGELNQIAESDIADNDDLSTRALAWPIAIKGATFQDYLQTFVAASENQGSIQIEVYGSDSLVVFPIRNKKCWKMGQDEIPNRNGDSFSYIIDFNESENSGNLHYYVKNDVSGETKEGNIILKHP
jgi:hypothetical protein